jgi:hypothetical protein
LEGGFETAAIGHRVTAHAWPGVSFGDLIEDTAKKRRVTRRVLLLSEVVPG